MAGLGGTALPHVAPPGVDPCRVFLEKQVANLQRSCATIKRFDESVGTIDFVRFYQEFRTQVQAAGRDFLVTLDFEGDIPPAVLFDPGDVTSNGLDTVVQETLPQLRQRALACWRRYDRALCLGERRLV